MRMLGFGEVGARRLAFVLVSSAALLVTALPGTPGIARAAEPGPVITSPVAGQQVGGQVEVTVESTAPELLVAWGPEAEDERFLYPVSTHDGTATVTLSTSGYHGPTEIVARECPSSCDGPLTSVRVDVSNPAPQWEERAWLSEFHGDGALWGVKEDPWAWYGFWVDGEFQPPVFDLPFVGIDVARLGDGEHTVRMAHCTEHSHRVIEPVVCDLANATAPRTFTIRTQLHPTIDSVRPRTISPDGNGVTDVATVTMTADSGQLVFWHLAQGTETVTSGSFLAPTPGPYTFDVDGLDTQGNPLDSGTYTLRVGSVYEAGSSSPTPGVDDRPIFGESSTTLAIDLDAPDVTKAAATPAVFRADRRDQVTFTGELSERASHFRVRLLRDGAVVRRLWLGPRPGGAFTATWDGHRPNGRLMRGGVYRYQFLTTDRAGNTAIRPGGTFELRSTR
jgi:flagellar hook assembly protein FlgD